MDKEKIILYSDHKIEISEVENDNTYMNVKFIICDFSVNKNGVAINRDTVEEWLSTLIIKPLVGFIALNKDDELDFTSHQAKKVYELDDGKIQQKLKFGTDAFGAFDNVQIETIEGIEYITANCRVWRRFENCCEIIQNRFDNNEPLNTSWEISIEDSSIKIIDGQSVKIINSGIFIGHALLSKYTTPAYDSSGMLEVAEEDEDNGLANAILLDLNKINELSSQSDENSVNDKLKNEGGNKMEKEKEEVVLEISSLTTEDLYRKVEKAVRVVNNDNWYYISRIYPLEYRAVAHACDGLDEDYIEFSYSVSENGDVSITGQREVKMVFVPQTENDQTVAELKDKIKLSEETIVTKEAELSAKVDEIVKLGEAIKTHEETIAEKDKAIAELEPLKAIAEAEAKVKEEDEIAEKKQNLSNILVSSKYFTEEEVAKSEVIQEAIAELSETKIKNILADKVVEVASKVEKTIEVEVSEVKTPEVSTDIKGQEYNYSPTGNKISDWLKNNK